MSNLVERVSQEMNGLSVRELVIPALKKAAAWRDNEIHQKDTLKQAIRTLGLAEWIKGYGVPGTEKEIAIELTELAKNDQSLRPYSTYVGGSWPDVWNNHEWSLPPAKE